MQDFRMETFLTVCRTLNYTEAARILHITQPAVSQHIRQIEAHYGVRLFSHEGRQTRLTEAGRRLQEAAVTLARDDRLLCTHLATGDVTPLVFGATLTVADFDMPARLVRLMSRQPDARIRMEVGNTQTLLQGIDAGTLDFAVIEGFFKKAAYAHAVCSWQRFIAVCSPTHPFEQTPRRFADLAGERVILREPGSGSREILERYMAERNGSVTDFARALEVGSISAIKTIAAAGGGIAFLYEAAVRQELAAGVLRHIELEDFQVSHDFTMVWRKGSLFQKQYESLFHTLFPDAAQPVSGPLLRMSQHEEPPS